MAIFNSLHEAILNIYSQFGKIGELLNTSSLLKGIPVMKVNHFVKFFTIYEVNRLAICILL